MAKTFEVHPSIGISRVGNSEEFFFGPPGGEAFPETFRDTRGRLKRQAARFRVFECDRTKAGVLRGAVEVTPDVGQIEWTVHVANRKGASEAFKPRNEGEKLRNPGQADRSKLVIDPGARTLAGAGQRAIFDGGGFLGRPVVLGDVRTNDQGQLEFAGGFGTSDFVSPDGSSLPITRFADNDFWFDDVSDGPVQAKVKLANGKEAIAEPAWVIVAPPKFAPAITNLVTLYDVGFDVAVQRKWRTLPAKASFVQHVQPILERAVGYQWVVKQAAVGHGPGTGGDFSSMLDFLADPKGSRSARERIFELLRDPKGPPVAGPLRMPRLHDSSVTDNVLPLTPSQYTMLTKWVQGKFVDDRATSSTAAVPVEPDVLDRASLDPCVGGPFYPGIEAGSIMQDPTIYRAAFRLDAAKLQPGQITAHNAVPWQADFWACTRDGQAELSWWPAQRPDDVRPDPNSPEMVRWIRGVAGDDDLVAKWHKLGIVVEVKGPGGRSVYAESERKLPRIR